MAEDKTAQDDQGKNQPDGDQGGAAVIELEGKQYTADDVKQLLGQVTSATQSNQIAAKLKSVAAKYDIDPEGYLGQAEGALGVISELIEKGIINEKGEIVQQMNEPRKDDKKGQDSLDDLFGKKQEPQSQGASNVEEIVAKAMAGITAKMDQLAEIQAGMIREDYGRKIKQSFPDLDDDDISRVFASYQRDRSIGLMDHAKKLAEKKGAFVSSLKEQLAKEWGVDLEKLEKEKSENDINDAEGKGGAGVLFKGKKFSMRQSGDDYVSPKEAAKEYFSKVMKER